MLLGENSRLKGTWDDIDPVVREYTFECTASGISIQLQSIPLRQTRLYLSTQRVNVLLPQPLCDRKLFGWGLGG